MSDDDRWRQLTSRLESVERRLARLEGSREAKPDTSAPAERTADAVPEAASTAAEWVPWIGRALLILAGAFLIRAVTERGVVPEVAGVALGLLYAVVWIFGAERSARHGHGFAAMVHGVSAVLIAYPLIWEATANFEFLAPRVAAPLLVAVSVALFWVSVRRELHLLTWLAACAAVASSGALAVGTRLPIPYTASLIALGVALFWLGSWSDRRGASWFVAAAVDLAALLLALMVLKADVERLSSVASPVEIVYLLLFLVAGYVIGIGFRIVRLERRLQPGDAIQGAVALVIGIGGALIVCRSVGLPSAGPGIVSGLLGLGCYGASFSVVDRRTDGRREFVFFTSAALALTLAFAVTFLHGGVLTLVLLLVAVAVAWVGARRQRATLNLHGAVYVIAAAVASALLPFIGRAMFGTDLPRVTQIDLPILATLAAAAAFCRIEVATHGRTWGRFSRVPRTVVLAVLIAGLGAIVVSLLAELLPARDGAQTILAVVAPLRTSVICLSAVALSLVSARRGWIEARWLVQPFLWFGAAKLLLEDVRTGRPATLFVSLGLYGVALILVPRISRRASPRASDVDGPSG